MLPLIPRPLHAVLDYIYAATALALPTVAKFEDQTASRTLKIMGAATILSALCTRHEGGIWKLVPFNTHLKLDFASGVFALAAPFLLGFGDKPRARNSFIALALTAFIVFALSRRDKK